MLRASKRARVGWCRVLARALCAVAPAMAQGEVTAKRNRFVAKTAENGAWPTRGGCKGRPGGGPAPRPPGCAAPDCLLRRGSKAGGPLPVHMGARWGLEVHWSCAVVPRDQAGHP